MCIRDRYQDAFYYSRRPTIAVPAGQVLQIGTDAAGRAIGLHPRLTGLREIFNAGRPDAQGERGLAWTLPRDAAAGRAARMVDHAGIAARAVVARRQRARHSQ